MKKEEIIKEIEILLHDIPEITYNELAEFILCAFWC